MSRKRTRPSENVGCGSIKSFEELISACDDAIQPADELQTRKRASMGAAGASRRIADLEDQLGVPCSNGQLGACG